jgi:putative ABC transport system substrate-binding protein
MSEFAAEFVRLRVDVIITAGTAAVIAVKQATSIIPIIATAADPVWARPGRKSFATRR